MASAAFCWDSDFSFDRLTTPVYPHPSRGSDIAFGSDQGRLKQILASLGIIAVAVIVSVESASAGARANFTVLSDPPGALVRLTGEAIATGVAPVTFRFPLIGRYRVTVSKEGYESHSETVIIDPTQAQSISVTLVPKSRLKAAARSLFIPGWGHHYSDQKNRAWLFHLFAASAVGFYFATDAEFDRQNRQFLDSETAYERALAGGAGRDELDARLRLLRDDRTDAFDAETVRRVAIGTVIGVWSLAILDNLLFFPDRKDSFSVKGFAVAPDFRDGGFGLQLTKVF